MHCKTKFLTDSLELEPVGVCKNNPGHTDEPNAMNAGDSFAWLGSGQQFLPVSISTKGQHEIQKEP